MINMNYSAGWSMQDASERADILEPIGLICDNGYFEDNEYKVKLYNVRSKYSFPDSRNGILLNQKQFDHLLKTKPIFNSKHQFEKWLEMFKRKEKLDKINNFIKEGVYERT